MSRLEELIAEYCPNGVNQLKIADLTNYEQPSKYIVKSTDYNDSFDTPVLTAGQTFILGYTNETDGIYAASVENPVIIFDDFTGALKWVNFSFKVKSSAMKIITAKKKILIRYLYHVMANLGFTSDEHKRLWISMYAEQKIPVPPLPVQSEIVRILDNFTELTAELTAELTERKKQYEYYRDALLTFGDDVEWKTLGECVLKTAKIRWGENKEESFQYIDLSSVNRDDNKIYETKLIYSDNAPSRAQQIVVKNDVIFGSTRPMLKRYCLVPEEYDNQICSTGFCVLRANLNLVLPKWVFYNISTSAFYTYIEKNQKGASYPAISDKEVKAYKIPLPPIEEQQRIIDILDRFDTLCNDISAGLPAEIAARQKQYEYYRDKLLTFKKLT
jgi:type I restriction enzyme S subunit